MTGTLAEALQAYASLRLPDAGDVLVSDVSRIPGGASRETYRFRLSYRLQGEPVSRSLILRRDPPSSLLETDRRIEFMAFRAFYKTAVPVPEMLWLEEDGAHLERPFFVAEDLAGYEADPLLLQTEPYLSLHRKIGERKWRILGEIARQSPDDLGMTALFPAIAPEQIWRHQLDHWESVLRGDAIRAEPVMHSAIRWLRRNPPPTPRKLSVVHGDFRSGNFLYDTQGEIHAILDWEMTHIGDPLEDLAWSLNRAWCYTDDARAGGLLPRADAIALWEDSSGLDANPAGLHWWELFSCVKAQALWVSAGRNWLDSTRRDVINVAIAWILINRQDRAALELMGRL